MIPAFSRFGKYDCSPTGNNIVDATMLLWHRAMKIAGAHGLGSLTAGSTSCLAGAAAAWHAEVSRAAWSCEADLLDRHPHALIQDGRVLFDLGHDDHCVVVRVNYGMQSVLMTYIGPRSGAPWPKPRPRRSKAAS